MNKCKITVIKRLYNKELIDEYCSLNLPENYTGCPRFKLGDEFIVQNHNDVPPGFCAWAWADIHKDLLTIMFDGNIPWVNKKGVAITCCTDGLMPVVFKVEKVE